MWVYQSNGKDLPEDKPDEKVLPQSIPVGETGTKQLLEMPDGPMPERKIQSQNLPKEPCGSLKPAEKTWLFATAFLIGTVAAGILQAWLKLEENEVVLYYLQRWSSIFGVSDSHAALSLFAMEYLSLGILTSILAAFGFSAFGPVLIYLTMMFYGLGSGLLLLGLCARQTPGKAAVILLLSAFPAAFSEGWICVFASTAWQSGERLRKYAFCKNVLRASGAQSTHSGVVLGQYILTMFLLLLLCGLSTGFAYLSSLF